MMKTRHAAFWCALAGRDVARDAQAADGGAAELIGA
jgi:hypothetical protein